MSKDDEPLDNLMAIQRRLAEIADPGGFVAMQRKMAQRAGHGGFVAMQRKMARLTDPGGFVAMQRKMAQRAGHGGFVAMQRKMARLTDPGGFVAMQRKMAQRAGHGGFVAMQRKMARLTDPGGLMAMQRKMAQRAGHGGFAAMQRKMARLADPGGLMAMQRKMARLAELGAVQLTAQLSPGVSLDKLASAIGRVNSGLLGTAATAVAAAFPRHVQIATEALSALATLEMVDQDAARVQTLKDQSPLMAAIAELRTAVDDSHPTADVEKLVAEVVERVVAKLASSSSSPRAPRWDLPTVIAFVSLLVAAIFGVSATGFSTLTELRAKRQEAEAAKDQQLADERAATVQRALARLVELHEQEAELRAAAVDKGNVIRVRAWYVVRRAVILRQRNSARSSPHLHTLYPGTVVEVIGQTGKRVQVRYFDHLRGEEQVGWVLKKYLVRIDP
ncbi:hypothetical protein [Sorangium sp. So ce1335]|uniref:hypothetical protein n=1 Tax=Sorangium sp. So ce1335 TaxID=3133335 RepID=UPI003F5F39A2